MTQHTCAKCEGTGSVCEKCGRPKERHRAAGCRGRKRVPCPGVDGEPHVDTRTECDVCRVVRLGPFYRASSMYDFHTSGWGITGNALSPGERLHLCPECETRLGMLRELAMERLKEERGELRAGQLLGPQGETP